MKQSPSGTNSEYNQHVALKYQLYNSFFLTLPLGGVKDVGILIPVLAETCRTKLQQGETPKNIIEQFLTAQPNPKDQTAKFDFLFLVIQFVERQVVFIDALEDATFEDLHNFKKLTINSIILMGRKTWESLPFKPLPKRRNIVISHRKNLNVESYQTIHECTLKLQEEKIENIYIIGGAMIYNSFIDKAHELHITQIDENIENIDTFFPLKIEEIKQSFIKKDEHKLAINATYSNWHRINSI